MNMNTDIDNYIHVKITSWSPSSGIISLESDDEIYTNLNTDEKHQDIYMIIQDATHRCLQENGEQTMNGVDNSWLVKLNEGSNKLLEIKWIPLRKLREKKLNDLFNNKIVPSISKVFKK